MNEFKLNLVFIIFLFFAPHFVLAQSGGPLNPAQASYDIKYYDLDLEINPADHTIQGSLLCTAGIINSVDTFILDLDDPFTIDSVLFKRGNDNYSAQTFTHTSGKLNITVPVSLTAGDLVSVKIFYGGSPRISEWPPWAPGFVWDTTSSGKPWIGVACETGGGDIWWPCKDHPSDKPDSVSLSLTVPNPLQCISNGKFIGSTDNGNNTSTFNWFVSTPISNYNVTFYAAEYSLIEEDYESVRGETIPFYFWVLPEDYQAASDQMEVFETEFNFLESVCGPFPFSGDKHGFAHAPYLGMEHQTIIAYGGEFVLNEWGFDYIHYHELAHEWWGNLVTARDFSDIWIHEGLATYMEALYVEHLSGIEAYHQYINSIRPEDSHVLPLAPRESLTAEEGLFGLDPYYRGASVIHTLRFHLGDEIFFNLLKRWVYPDPEDFDNTNGHLGRLVTTDDMKNLAEEVTGRNLDDFFEVFFREAAYPYLIVSRGPESTSLSWITENNVPLGLDVPVKVNGIEKTVEMTNGEGSLEVSITDNFIIDPDKWILMADPVIITSGEEVLNPIIDYILGQNYPNPFNPRTTITYSIPERAYVCLKIFDLLGREVSIPVNGEKDPGTYEAEFDAGILAGGIYFYTLQAGSFNETKKMVLLK